MKYRYKILIMAAVIMLILTGCTKREKNVSNEKYSDSDYESAEDESHGKKINKKIGEKGKELIIDADVIVSDTDMQKGTAKGVLPSVEEIEKNLCDGRELVKQKNTDPNYGGTDWMIQDKNGNEILGYSYDDYTSIFTDNSVEGFDINLIQMDSNLTGQVKKTEQDVYNKLKAIGYSSTLGFHLDGINKDKGKMYFCYSSNINKCPVVEPDLGTDYTDVEVVDGKIAAIRFQKKYSIVSSEKINIVKIESIITHMENEYKDGKFPVMPITVKRIKLMYYVNDKNELLPVWTFVYMDYKNREKIAYIYNAVTGKQIYNPEDGISENE